MRTTFKVWVQIERCPPDAEPINIELPDCMREFDNEHDARTFVEALLIATGSEDLQSSDQLPIERYQPKGPPQP